MKRVLFLNNDGAGFAGEVEVQDHTTVGDFVAQRMPGYNANDLTIRLNHEATHAGKLLEDGDRVSVTPRKIEGA